MNYDSTSILLFGKQPMTSLIAGTEFEWRLRTLGEGVTDVTLRHLVFAYSRLYQELYWFNQLENAFTYLELAETDPEAVRTELDSVRSEVEDAMGEYFESLNELARVIHRLLDDTPFTVDDSLSCINHVWKAHSCNEKLANFSAREDKILCDLFARTVEGQ